MAAPNTVLDLSYSFTSLANNSAPTADGTATDPEAPTLMDAGRGAFTVTDKYVYGGVRTDLVLLVEGGSATDITVHMFFKAINKWLPLKSVLTPGVGSPVRLVVPAFARLFIQVVNKGAATALYAFTCEGG